MCTSAEIWWGKNIINVKMVVRLAGEWYWNLGPGRVEQN